MRKVNARRAAGLALCAALAGSLAACGGNDDNDASGPASGDTEGATSSEIAFWDPYPQYTEGSDWDNVVKGCAPEGATIVRTSAPTADLINDVTTAVREDNAPDLIALDNPSVPEAVGAGLIAPADEVGIDPAGVDQNLLGPGVVAGVTYGVPWGSNALGLYYNKAVLDAAGVDPASITSWDSFNAALEKVVASGAKGLTFSGIAGEEGVFQAEPWFWGAGADLADLGSAEAVSVGQLMSDWIAKGYAPKSAITDNQSVAWDLFITGEYGFAENGSWFAQAAADANFEVGVIPIPSKAGGVAPVPTGGEFVMAPVHKDNPEQHYANAAALVACLLSPENYVKVNEALGYLAAKPDVRAEQVAAKPMWEPWVASIEGAQGRTTELGAGYLEASALLSEALQASLNAEGDTAAIEQAFKDAGDEQ
jgi:multiple sugar transport system substrate-binding protein